VATGILKSHHGAIVQVGIASRRLTITGRQARLLLAQAR
jgi:hypothetical protein